MIHILALMTLFMQLDESRHRRAAQHRRARRSLCVRLARRVCGCCAGGRRRRPQLRLVAQRGQQEGDELTEGRLLVTAPRAKVATGAAPIISGPRGRDPRKVGEQRLRVLGGDGLHARREAQPRRQPGRSGLRRGSGAHAVVVGEQVDERRHRLGRVAAAEHPARGGEGLAQQLGRQKRKAERAADVGRGRRDAPPVERPGEAAADEAQLRPADASAGRVAHRRRHVEERREDGVDEAVAAAEVEHPQVLLERRVDVHAMVRRVHEQAQHQVRERTHRPEQGLGHERRTEQVAIVGAAGGVAGRPERRSECALHVCRGAPLVADDEDEGIPVERLFEPS